MPDDETLQSSESMRHRTQIAEAVVRAMGEGVVVYGPDGTSWTANAAAARILGVAPAQLVGGSPLDTCWRLTRPDGLPAGPGDVPSEITRTTARPCRDVLLGVQPPGQSRRWVRINSDPFFDESGNRLGVVATFADVTAEQEGAAKLTQANERLAHVVDAVPGAVYSYRERPSGRVDSLFVSSGAPEVLGVTVEQAMADPACVWHRVHPDDAAQVRASLDEARFAEGAMLHWEDEFRLRRLDDSGYRWVRARAVLEKQGGSTTWTGVCIDAHAAHEMAQTLHRGQRQRAVAQLATGIAHNFNNLLAVIIPNLQTVKDEVEGELGECLADAEEAAHEAAGLVRQLSMLARPVDTHGQTGPGDLVRATSDAVLLCRATFRSNVAVECHLPEVSVQANASEDELQQLVLNLCLNARDALDPIQGGRISLVLRVEPAEDGLLSPSGEVARLTVRDTGHGMPPEVLQRLGEPFFTTRLAEGAQGLGLATVFATVRAVDGTIHCDSTVGEGTVVEVCLPVLG